MANITNLIRDGKVSLPCGDYAVASATDRGMDLVGKRGKRVCLTVVVAGVSGHPDAVGFVIHDHRSNIGEYAMLGDGRVVDCI